MGNSQPLDRIVEKHQQPGIDKLLDQYDKIKVRDTFEEQIAPNGVIGKIRSTDLSEIQKKKQQLFAHYEKQKRWLNQGYPLALEKAVKQTRRSEQHLCGYEEEVKKIDNLERDVKRRYEEEIERIRTELGSHVKTGMAEYDSLPPKYKEDVLQQSHQKYSTLRKSQIKRTYDWEKRFSNFLDNNALHNQIEKSKEIISVKVRELVGIEPGCCACCSHCCPSLACSSCCK